MNIRVVFEIIISGFAVIGMYATFCELIKILLCRKKYYIAVKTDGKTHREIAEDVYMAYRLIGMSTGAVRRVILLSDEEDNSKDLSSVNADRYVRSGKKEE